MSSILTSDIGEHGKSQLVYMVRIPRFHRGGPGSIPGLGKLGAAINYATVKDVGDGKR